MINKIWDGTEWVEGDPISDTFYHSETPPENTTWNWVDTTATVTPDA